MPVYAVPSGNFRTIYIGNGVKKAIGKKGVSGRVKAPNRCIRSCNGVPLSFIPPGKYPISIIRIIYSKNPRSIDLILEFSNAINRLAPTKITGRRNSCSQWMPIYPIPSSQAIDRISTCNPKFTAGVKVATFGIRKIGLDDVVGTTTDAFPVLAGKG